MKAWVHRSGVLALGLFVSGTAAAQTSSVLSTHTASQQAPATQPNAPPPPPPAPAAAQPAPPSGRWVSTADHGWVWVPSNATTVNVDGVPYAYLYTPAVGWTWYVSPWGWGPFHYGVWVRRPWHPAGVHYWVAPHHVVVRLGPRWR